MLLRAGPAAAPLAALLAAPDPLRGSPPDLLLRLAAISKGRDNSDPALARIRSEARALARAVPATATPAAMLTPAQMTALAYPDRIGLRRAGEAPRWLLSGGKGAKMAPLPSPTAMRAAVTAASIRSPCCPRPARLQR